MTRRVAATGWWGLLLLAVVACTADAEQEVAPSTSAVATTDGASLPDTVVGAEASTQPDATTSTTEPPSTTTSSTTSTSTPSTTSPTAPAVTDPSTTTIPTVTTTSTSLPDNLTIVEVMVREGRVVSESRVDIPLGDRILMRFDTDSRLLVHVHGYDQEFWVEAGNSSAHEFEGNIPGIFEVEDHVTHRPLLELQVSP